MYSCTSVKIITRRRANRNTSSKNSIWTIHPLCTSCGRLSHLVHSCLRTINDKLSTSTCPNTNNLPIDDMSTSRNENEGWTVVVYPRKNKKFNSIKITQEHPKYTSSPERPNLDSINNNQETTFKSTKHLFPYQTHYVTTQA